MGMETANEACESIDRGSDRWQLGCAAVNHDASSDAAAVGGPLATEIFINSPRYYYYYILAFFLKRCPPRPDTSISMETIQTMSSRLMISHPERFSNQWAHSSHFYMNCRQISDRICVRHFICVLSVFGAPSNHLLTNGIGWKRPWKFESHHL